MLDPRYVSGLTEGIGSFTYSRASGTVALYFALRVPEKNRELLTGIRDFFGAGQIYPAGDCLYFRINRHDELHRVVRHFDDYPLVGHKRAAFRIWREMVLLKARFRQPDRRRLQALAQKLSALTAERRRR